MRPAGLPIDFTRARSTRTAAAIGLGAAALALGLGLVWWMGEQRLRELRIQVAMAEGKERDANRPRPSRLTPELAGSINEAVARLNTPWEHLFVVLNAADAQLRPRTVALLSLEPDGTGQALKLSAEARSVEAMLAYLRALQSQPTVSSAVLTRHELVEDQDQAAGTVRFWVETRLTTRPDARP